MNIKYKAQPKDMYCCGQCCVAMFAGISLHQAFKAFGTKGSTKTKDISKALRKLKNRSATRLMPIYGDFSKLPETAILKVKLDWEKYNWHWVLKCGGKIYDPGKNGVMLLSDYRKVKGYNITSYLKIS